MMRTTFSIFILFGSLVALFVIVQSTMRVRTGDASVAPPAQGAAPPVEAVAPPARMAERLRDPSAQREPARFSSPTCAGDLATGEPKSRSAADIQADNERLAVVQTALLEIQKQQADDKAAVNANAKILDHSFEDSSSEIGAAAAPGAAELEKPVAGPEPPKETPPPVADAKENEVPKETVPGEPGRLPTGPPVVKTTEAELTPTMIALREKLRDTLAAYHQRPENVAARSPWGAMHAMIAYGVDAELIAGFQRVNAIGWLCYNGNCNNQTLFWTQNGKLQTKIGPGVQGHAGQFLSMLAQSRVKTDYPLVVDGRKFTVADLIEYEKLTCQTRTELTFKLIALSHYLKSNETWRAQDGQAWDIPRLIQEELSQPIIGAACGGTHRLTGFAYAVRKRQQRGEPVRYAGGNPAQALRPEPRDRPKRPEPPGEFAARSHARDEEAGFGPEVGCHL